MVVTITGNRGSNMTRFLTLAVIVTAGVGRRFGA